MDALPTEAGDELRSDLRVIQQAIRAGVVSSRARAADKHWDRWVDFCESISLDPWLVEVDDPIPILQVFGARYHDGRIAPRGKPVRAHTVEDAIPAMGQTFARFARVGLRTFAKTQPAASTSAWAARFAPTSVRTRHQTE